MVERNRLFFSLSALVLVLIFALFVVLAVTDGEEGLTMFSASLEERVSYAYLLKSASDPMAVGSAGVVPGGNYENGSANIVTAIVADYRILDTFGEVLVLFVSSAGVALLMSDRKRKVVKEASVIVKTAVPIIMLFALVVGFYIVLHGHLSPGGGFPGGAVIASAFILQFLAFSKKAAHRIFRLLESLSGLGLLTVGLIGLFAEGSFFANVMSPGALGATVSAGMIMIIYGLIGVKVASELSSISADFIGE